MIENYGKTVAKAFVPEWKHFKTWINNSCWEEQFGESQSTGIDSKLCVVDRKPGRSYQYDANKQKTWLCEDCLQAIKKAGVQNFGILPVTKIEELVLKGRAVRA